MTGYARVYISATPVMPPFRHRPGLPCHDTDPETFFPTTHGTPDDEVAKAVCGTCDIRNTCLAWTTEARIGYGIWGGHTPRERVALRQDPARLAKVRADAAREQAEVAA